MKRFLWILLFCLTAVVALPGAVFAQQPTPSDDEVNAIARQLYCPVCANTPLDVCPTQACAQWRELIRQKLAAGWSEEQIKQYFVDQYGVRVLAEPPRQGFYWTVYVIPPILLALGAFILFRAFRGWRATPVPAKVPGAGSGPGSDDAYVARLEEELHKRR